jgi:hypothetical protein
MNMKRMKGLNLSGLTWSFANIFNACESMWKEVSFMYKKQPYLSIQNQKYNWMQKRYPKEDFIANCFFCEWAATEYRNFESKKILAPPPAAPCNYCGYCPGRIVSPSFYCTDSRYSYEYVPTKFYEKIRNMNMKRKAERITP